jgi:hypothetical protein
MGQEYTAASETRHAGRLDDAAARDDSGTLTRRTLVGGAAAAGVASLIAPAAGLASVGAGRRSITTRWVGALSGESPPLAAPVRFSLVGVRWSAPTAARIELRAQAPDARWSPWVNASVLGHDGDGQPADRGLFGEPLWTDTAQAVQLRTNQAAQGVRLYFVSVTTPRGAWLAGAPPRALPILDAGPGQPPIIARAAWAGGHATPHHFPEYATVKLAFVHHTVNPNGYSAAAVPEMLRGIFDYHVFGRGYWDIAYNFIIDLYGRIWEARAGGIDMPVIGAHAGAYNAESTGVAILGDFANVIPSSAAIAALEQLVAWKLSLHGVPSTGRVTVVVNPEGASYSRFPPGAHVSLPRVAGHRDGDTTDCPGNALYYDLPAIRPHITSLAGNPARLTIAAPAAAVAPGSPVTVSGHLRSLSGAPLAGAPLEIQLMAPTGPPDSTVGTTQTGSDGSWSGTVTSQRNTLVRALHRPHPAAVSDWVELAVAPVITLAATSTSPLVLAGTVSPAKRSVTVFLYRAGHTGGKRVKKRRVNVSRGRFTAHLPAPPPGTYVAIARTAADASTAAGASPPVTVTVP